ncbi:MAG TPA: ATP-binding protein [Burkholderiales bacterium]|nr:ATP-binding protein [Burkholderiales bacterium]
MAQARSLKHLMLFYALGYLLLVLASGALGGAGLYLWHQSSEESLRINSMVGEIQEMRGNLYRQVKEVFDAVFLNDPDAARQYQEYQKRIELHLENLDSVAAYNEEHEAINRLREAYNIIKTQAADITRARAGMPLKQKRKIFDTDLEMAGFGRYEEAFNALEQLLQLQQAELQNRLVTLTQLAPLLLLLPILLAVVLLLLSRIFMQRAIVRPLSALQEAATLISHGDLSHKVPEKGAAELVTLAQTVNRMADDLATSRESLLRAEKQATLGALVPVMAHNIRNPLASIRATAQIINDSELSAELREGLSGIISTADRLERWTHSLLSYLHPLKAQRSLCKLPQLVDNVLELLKPRLAEKDIQVVREGWDGQIEIALDVQLVEQALHGLLANAMDASPRRGKLEIRMNETAQDVRLTIADQGSGMPFTPAAGDLSPGPSTKSFGSGLGIPFAMKVCDAHGGKIEFQSSNPHGTEVRLILSKQIQED